MGWSEEEGQLQTFTESVFEWGEGSIFRFCHQAGGGRHLNLPHHLGHHWVRGEGQ